MNCILNNNTAGFGGAEGGISNSGTSHLKIGRRSTVLTIGSTILRLDTQTAPNFSKAHNTLTLHTEGPICNGVVKIDIGHLQPGDRAGLCLLEQNFGYLAVYKDAYGQRLVRVVNKNGDLKAPSEDITDTVSSVTATTLWLQVHCDFRTNTAQFAYSADGKNFTAVGEDFPMHFTLTTFQSERFGIFCYNPTGSPGWLDVDSFQQGGGSPAAHAP